LIAAGAGVAGGALGLSMEGATLALARVTGGRFRATALLAGGGLGAVLWARRTRRRANAPIETAGQLLLFSAAGGELAVAAVERIPAEQRRRLLAKVGTTVVAAASAVGAVRQKLAEPRDPVKASILYDYRLTVSGGPGSRLPLDRLDREGRKYLGNAIPADRIAEVMGEDAASDPVRVFAGLDSAENPAERARLAVAELERLGGFDRSRIVFFCPTGAGFVNPVAVETEELMSRGDVASVVVQYSNKRAVRAFKDLETARTTWRSVLEELDRALATRPSTERPEIVVYGESLGCWVVAEALSERGPETIEALHIARGALIGVPHTARRKLRAIRESGVELPEGLGIFGSLDELMALPQERLEQLRYVLYTHPEDPVGLFNGARLIWERPEWLTAEARHPRVPRMRWLPWITYLHLLFDLKNGTGHSTAFANYAHDYRTELPTLLRVAFGHHDVTNRQLQAIEEETVRSAERQARREARAHVGPRT
jgi:uncharacterized membrane protein